MVQKNNTPEPSCLKNILFNVCISLLSIVLSFLIIEGSVRYYFSQNLNYDFEMWRYATELKESLSGSMLPFHHKPGKSGNYYGVEIKTNSEGLRDVEYKIPKPNGMKRVLMLGDSFTLGWGVSFEDTFTKQLEKRLLRKSPGYQVINMGTGNYNSSMEVELLKRKGLALEPDIIVLMYYINDTELTPKIGGISYYLMRHFYLLAYTNSKLKQLGMMNSSDDWLQAYYTKLYSPDYAGFRNAKYSINELIKITSENKIKLLIVNIPDLRRLEKYPFGFASDLPKGVAEANSVPYLDLYPSFNKYDVQSLWVSPEDPHMSKKANQLTAEAIFNKITIEKW